MKTDGSLHGFRFTSFYGGRRFENDSPQTFTAMEAMTPRILSAGAGDDSMNDCDGLREQHVVTAFLRREDRILILRRSERVGSYQGRWAGVSGYLEDPAPLDQAFREIHEETGLTATQLELFRAGPVLRVPDRELGRCWVVHPFLFDIREPAPPIRLDREHREMCWIRAEELAEYATVPALADALAACLQPDMG